MPEIKELRANIEDLGVSLYLPELKERIDELTEALNYHNRKYYIEDSPEIEDYEYDMI